MNCKITYTPDFARALKKLSKRYRSMKQDYAQLLEDLHQNPFLGTELGHRLRKVRLAITSKGKGKSGGARVITYTVIFAQADTEVKLITIYDKSERDNISDAELLEILRRNGIEVPASQRYRSIVIRIAAPSPRPIPHTSLATPASSQPPHSTAVHPRHIH